MNAHDVLKYTINSTFQMVDGYLGDLNDQELFHRPAAECNHINWQLGHLINAQHQLVTKHAGGKMPPLPDGFSVKYDMDKTKGDNPADFCSKAELLAIRKEQHEAALATLDNLSADDLGKPTGMEWAPRVGDVLNAASATHWLMHIGQWAVIRRQLGRKPLF
jgi:hypothetical protein